MKRQIARCAAAAAFLGWAVLQAGQAQGQAPVDPAGRARITADTTLPTAGRTFPGADEAAPVAVPQAITDAQIATWLGVDNRNEIVISQIGVQQAQSPLVRDFAQQMIREHSNFGERMRQIAGLPTMPENRGDAVAPAARPPVEVGASPEIEAGRAEIGETPGVGRFELPGVNMNSMRGTRATGARDAQIGTTRGNAAANVGTVTGVPNTGTPAGLRAEASATEFIGRQQTASDASGAGVQTTARDVVDADSPNRLLSSPAAPLASAVTPPRPAMNLLDLREQIGRHHLQLLQRELVAKQGPEFDQAFVRHQVEAHLQMLAALRSMRDLASPDLQTVLDQGAQATERHLQQARGLLSSLEVPQQTQTAAEPASEAAGTPRRR